MQTSSPTPRPMIVPPGVDATRVARRLYVGSLPPRGAALRDAGFHVLVLCALPEEYRYEWKEDWYVAPHVQFDGLVVLRAPLDDDGEPSGRPGKAELAVALDVATRVAVHVVRGRRALVTCMKGRNRSAFVAALALHRLTGRSGEECAARVRETRGEATGPAAPVLCNPWFNDVLAGLPGKARPSPASVGALR